VNADDPDEAAPLEEDFLIPVTQLNTNEPGTVYVAFKNTSGSPYPACTFSNILKFTSKDVDPSTGEPEETSYEDEYQVEDLDLGGSDFVVPAFAGSWEGVWDGASGGDEASETLVLSGTKTIAGKSKHGKLVHSKLTAIDAVTQLTNVFQLQPLDGSDVALSNSTHMLKLYGKSINGGKVAVRVRMAFSAKTGVTIEIRARSEEEGMATAIVSSVA
jgi:coatomer protein complex subunit gamma